MDGSPLPIGARAFDVLQALIERRERVVSKSELLDVAWPGLVVEESNLPVQISALRKVLGQDAIATIPTFGYRFVCEVEDQQRGATAEARMHDQVPNNLPFESTTLFARNSELAELRSLLSLHRLVTLTGVAGIGKSRLALRAASEARPFFADGVWLVACDSISDSTELLCAIARAVGVEDRPGQELDRVVLQHLKARRLLLVLDGCERFADACAQFVHRALRSAAGLTILTTSREPLQVEGERIFNTAPLDVDAEGATTDELALAPALELFIDRARSVRPDIALTPSYVETVSALCRRLDGIPLAIELAAGRLVSMTIDELATRLNERFTLLTGGRRSALPRHQTMRAAFDWSYDMLSDAERVVLQRLTVFAGSFTLEAAAHVASDAALEPETATNVLFRLAARSMVVTEIRGARTRLRLLQGVRDYALERLRASNDDQQQLERRRAEYLTRHYERAMQNWFTMSDREWQQDYMDDVDDVRAALVWALGDSGDDAIGIALAGRSAALWVELTFLRTGRQYLEQADARQASVSAHDRARLKLWLGVLRRDPDAGAAASALETASALFEAIGDNIAHGYSLARLAGALSRTNRIEEAQRALERSLPLLEGAPPKVLARYYDEAGDLKTDLGDLSGARLCYERALALYEYAGADRYVLITLGGLADVSMALGDVGAARVRFEEAVEKMRRAPIKNMYSMGNFLSGLADIYTEAAEADKAWAAIREGRLLLEKTGLDWSLSDHDAMRVALRGEMRGATRIAGYMDASFSGANGARNAHQARVRDRVQQMLAESLGVTEASLLLSDGAKMTSGEAKRLAS